MQLRDGRPFRGLKVLDDLNRKGLGIALNVSMPALLVVRILDHVIEWRVTPNVVRGEKGPKIDFSDLPKPLVETWDVCIGYIQLGDLQQTVHRALQSKATQRMVAPEHLRNSRGATRSGRKMFLDL